MNGFKSYSQASYVPICENDKYKFSTLMGKNGIGKSAILEALNFFFKQAPWNEYKGEKPSKSKEDKFVSPVFLIQKKSIHIWLENHPEYRRRATETISDLKEMSEFLWENSDDYFKGGA
ncbi:AAA family ATPase [Lysinibacillus sphaericus]|uniref:AAA family ATPase n=1 Tax=Lysinibacillus sphaericus TaxID=1421 RepID=UPI0022A87C24|nr:AAA family ATPase [Lysinibacillus sphaericus]